MPLNGHSYLVGQGWEGKGKGLRQDAISRPLAIPQKRTLAGLGKDRDEAFPFWDHLFTAAAKTIAVKLHKDGDSSGSSDTEEAVPPPSLTRTSTGLLSNKRPILGTPASSGTSTPTSSSSGTQTPRMSLITVAKRESARKGLYSRFFRGPVLGPETLDVPGSSTMSTPSLSVLVSSSTVMSNAAAISIPAVGTVASSPSDQETGQRVNDRTASEADSQRSSSKEERQKRREERRLRKEEKKLRKANGKEKEAERDIVHNDDRIENAIGSEYKKKTKGEDMEACREHAEEAGRKKRRKREEKLRPKEGKKRRKTETG